MIGQYTWRDGLTMGLAHLCEALSPANEQINHANLSFIHRANAHSRSGRRRVMTCIVSPVKLFLLRSVQLDD